MRMNVSLGPRGAAGFLTSHHPPAGDFPSPPGDYWRGRICFMTPAVQQSIEPPGPQQQTHRTLLYIAGEWDGRRTDTLPLYRPCRILCKQRQKLPADDRETSSVTIGCCADAEKARERSRCWCWARLYWLTSDAMTSRGCELSTSHQLVIFNAGSVISCTTSSKLTDELQVNTP